MRQDCGDNSYIIEDSVGDLEKIWREDIIHDDDDRNKHLRVRLLATYCVFIHVAVRVHLELGLCDMLPCLQS